MISWSKTPKPNLIKSELIQEVENSQIETQFKKLQKIFTNVPDSIIYVALLKSQEHEIPPSLVLSVISAESSFNPKAVSPKGAIGLMQVMPFWENIFPDVTREDLKSVNGNIEIGCRILKLNLEGRSVRNALSLYNWGRVGRKLPQETRHYIRKVTRLQNEIEKVLS